MNEDFKILSKLKNSATYQLPSNYFEHLATNILLKIKAQSVTFTVPNNYFNTLTCDILNKIKAQTEPNVYDELQQIAPLLNTISKQNIYTLPASYFETTLPNEVLKQPAKIISIKKIYKYVAAAVLIGFTSLVYISNTKVKTNDNIALQHNLALKINVSQEITSLQDVALNIAVENDKVLLTTDETAQNTIIPFLSDLQEEVKQLSDEELNAYLNNNNFTTDKEISDINS